MNLNMRNEEITAKIIIAVKKATFAVAKVHVHNYCPYYIQICFCCRSYVIPLLVQKFLKSESQTPWHNTPKPKKL